MDTIQFVKTRILQSSLSIEPWDHLYVEDFLPGPIYDKVDKETSSLINLTDLSKRKQLALSPSNDFCKVFKDKSVQDLLFEKFKSSGKCGEVPQPTIKKARIAYDVQPPGYRYRVHNDAPWKILSIIFYLAAKDDDEELGTRLYPGDKPPHTIVSLRRKPHKKIHNFNIHTDCVKISPYKPNAILIFSRNDPILNPSKYWTNHAMINSSTKCRRSIQVFYSDDPRK